MVTFFALAYSISLCLAIVTFSTLIYVMYHRWHTLKVLPYGLRLTMIVCYFPFAILFPISAIGQSIAYLIYERQDSPMGVLFSYGIITSSQTLRQFFLSFALERIVSTVFLESYSLSNKIALFWILVFFAFVSTSIYATLVIFYSGVIVIYSLSLIQVLSYYVFVVHLLTCFICGILYLLNKRMYRVTAYKISLKTRHKIMQNIKIISNMFPTVLIFTIFVPTWSIIVMVGSWIKLPQLPYCIQHIFNLLPILIISIRHYYIGKPKFAPKPSNKITDIKNAFGKNLPTDVTIDKYFQNLKQMWL